MVQDLASTMGWAFWRRNEGASGEDSPGASERDSETDPAAELRVRTRRRLIGAAALLLAAVFVVPMFLDSTPRPVSDTIKITVSGEVQPVKPATPETAAAPVVAKAEAVPDAAKVESAPTVAKVEAAPVEPAVKAVVQGPAPAPTRTTAEGEKFALQVAALSSVGAANQLVARLKKAGFVAYVEPIKTAEGPRHRVRIGPFANRDDAQKAGEKLRAAGFAAAVVGA